jgi:hypothetical protein
VESANFLEEKSRRSRSLSPKIRKGQIPKKSASKLKKLYVLPTEQELIPEY